MISSLVEFFCLTPVWSLCEYQLDIFVCQAGLLNCSSVQNQFTRTEMLWMFGY